MNLYGASVDALGDFLPKFGIYGDFVSDINDLAAVEATIGDDTKAIYTESVANPSTAVADIESLAQVTHRHGIPLIVDNTVPTPYLLRPIEFGAVQSPFNAYLQLIGLETLAVREKQEVASAYAITKHLQSVPRVKTVNYAALEGQPTTDFTHKYLPNGIGTVLSFTVEGDERNVERILDSTNVFSYVPNIGDSRSLIVNPTKATHREVPADYYDAAGVSDNLIRLSIGLENIYDLIADLDQAIAGAY